MKWTASAPVEWPSDDALAQIWAQLRAAIHSQDASTLYQLDEHGDGWQLVRGSHAAPGSAYQFVSPRLTRARLGGRIDDAGALHFELAGVPLRKGPIAAAGVADGLHHPRYITTNGQIGPLRWQVDGTLAERRLQGRVSLPWLKTQLLIAERGGTLTAELQGRVTGVTGPLLNWAAKEFALSDVQSFVEETVQGMAEALTKMARGELEIEEHTPAPEPAAPPPPDPVGEFDAYAARLIQVTRRLQSEMDHVGWFARRRRAWLLRALDELPSPASQDIGVRNHSHSLRTSVISQLSAVRHTARMRELDRIVTTEVPRLRAEVEAEAALSSRFTFADPEPTDYDRVLDLDWLATLRSTLRRLSSEAFDHA